MNSLRFLAIADLLVLATAALAQRSLDTACDNVDGVYAIEASA